MRRKELGIKTRNKAFGRSDGALGGENFQKNSHVLTFKVRIKACEVRDILTIDSRMLKMYYRSWFRLQLPVEYQRHAVKQKTASEIHGSSRSVVQFANLWAAQGILTGGQLHQIFPTISSLDLAEDDLPVPGPWLRRVPSAMVGQGGLM